MNLPQPIQLDYETRQQKSRGFNGGTFALLMLLVVLVGFVVLTSIGTKRVVNTHHLSSSM